MRLSIIMTYYNRKKLLYRTLKSILKSKIDDIEVIIVDDGSDENQRIEEFKTQFSFLKIIRIEKFNKWYLNPCIPFNIGIKEAVGEIIVLQNPECLHVHDVLSYINKTVTERNYISISTYAISKKMTEELDELIINNKLLDKFGKLSQISIGKNSVFGWYNHNIFRPTYYHFCSALTKKNMDKLGGFDKRYANGIAYDDMELVKRIEFLGLRKTISNDVSVLHQWHPKIYDNMINVIEKRKINRMLFDNVTCKDGKFKVN